MLVGQRLRYFAGGWPGKKLGAETIASLQMVNGDSLIKDFFGRGGNNVHITTPTDQSVLLQTIKDVTARLSFDTYCIRGEGYRAKAFKPSE